MNKNRFLKFIVAGLILTLIYSSINLKVVLVKADGAIATQEVWIQYRETNPSSWQSVASERSIDLDQIAMFRNFSTRDYDYLDIYRMRTYIRSSSSSGTVSLSFNVYNATDATDASDRVGEVDAGSFSRTGGYQILNYAFTGSEIRVYADEFFVGAYYSGGTLTNYQQLGYTGSWVEEENGHSDPFSEDYTGTSDRLSFQFMFYAYKNKTTTTNQYYGSATDFIARRDINYTFPSNADTKQLRITYPSDESIRNITYSNGGLWDSEIPSSEYTTSSLNGTHSLITIGNSAINSYGADLRLYTKSDDYVYTFEGAFYENGTSYGAVNITAHTTTDSETVLVDGETVYGSSDEFIVFSWELSGGGTRRFYTPSDVETLYIFFPEDTYATYEFSIIDYTGQLGKGDAYLEAYRSVNGSDKLIERMVIHDATNTVPINLVTDKVYRIKILWADDTTYDWGYFVPGVDPTQTLVLHELAFSQKAQLTYKHLSVEATRPNSTNIRVNYQDNSPSGYETDWVNITVMYCNQSIVATYSSTSETVTYNWYGADNETDYWVYVAIDQTIFSNDLEYWKLLDADVSYTTFPDLGILGTFGNIDVSNLLSLIIVLVIFGGFSRESAHIALILAFTMASILRIIGANTWDWNVLILGYAVSIAYAVYVGRLGR